MPAYLSAALVILELIAVALVWHAARHARTPRGAIGWAVFLVAAPYVAVPLYAVLGDHRFLGYRRARRKSAALTEEMRRFAEAYRPDPLCADAPPFEAIARMKAVAGNDFALLTDGRQAFDEMIREIGRAERYVLVQFYIFRDDGLGRRVRDALVAAAARGVEVRVLFDPVGSSRLPERYLDTLRAAGCEVMDRRTARGPSTFFELNYRNHRKTLVVDGRVGFTGGFNVGDEYLGLGRKFGPWRDTQLRIAGPMVQQLQLVFAEDWHWITRDHDILGDLDWTVEEGAGPADGLVVATGPGDGDDGEMLFIAAIAAARERVWIASPYFVPDRGCLQALKLAALRGVDVRVILPDRIDHRMPWYAAFAYFDEVRAAGVQIWRYTEGFMHQKALVVDDRIAGIGTANLDNRSFRLNFEAMALFFDARAARAVAEMLEDDLARAYLLETDLSAQPLRIRLLAPIANLFSPLL